MADDPASASEPTASPSKETDEAQNRLDKMLRIAGGFQFQMPGDGDVPPAKLYPKIVPSTIYALTASFEGDVVWQKPRHKVFNEKRGPYFAGRYSLD